MKRFKLVLVGCISAALLVAGASGAGADPVCDNFPGPRDGKARWYHALCS